MDFAGQRLADSPLLNSLAIYRNRWLRSRIVKFNREASMTRKRSFGCYGALLRNPMTDWSAISSDGKTMAVSLWLDEFRGRARVMVYEKIDTDDWLDGPGKRLFFEHLQYALDRCDGLARVVVSVRDPANRSRTTDCYAAPNLILRIANLDARRGMFRLEQILPTSKAA
jgi:hypothetical protein